MLQLEAEAAGLSQACASQAASTSGLPGSAEDWHELGLQLEAASALVHDATEHVRIQTVEVRQQADQKQLAASQQLQASQELCESLQSQLSKSLGSCELLHHDISSLKSACSDLSTAVLAKDESIETLRREAEHAQRARQELEAQVFSMQSRLQAQDYELKGNEVRIATLEMHGRETDATLASISMEREKYDSQLDNLQHQLGLLQAAKQQLKVELQDSATALEHLRQTIAIQQDHITTMETLHSEADTLQSMTISERHHHVDQLDDLQQQLVTAQASKTKLGEELQVAFASIVELQQQLQVRASQLAEADSQLEASRTQQVHQSAMHLTALNAHVADSAEILHTEQQQSASAFLELQLRLDASELHAEAGRVKISQLEEHLAAISKNDQEARDGQECRPAATDATASWQVTGLQLSKAGQHSSDSAQQSSPTIPHQHVDQAASQPAASHPEAAVTQQDADVVMLQHQLHTMHAQLQQASQDLAEQSASFALRLSSCRAELQASRSACKASEAELERAREACTAAQEEAIEATVRQHLLQAGASTAHPRNQQMEDLAIEIQELQQALGSSQTESVRLSANLVSMQVEQQTAAAAQKRALEVHAADAALQLQQRQHQLELAAQEASEAQMSLSREQQKVIELASQCQEADIRAAAIELQVDIEKQEATAQVQMLLLKVAEAEQRTEDAESAFQHEQQQTSSALDRHQLELDEARSQAQTARIYHDSQQQAVAHQLHALRLELHDAEAKAANALTALLQLRQAQEQDEEQNTSAHETVLDLQKAAAEANVSAETSQAALDKQMHSAHQLQIDLADAQAQLATAQTKHLDQLEQMRLDMLQIEMKASSDQQGLEARMAEIQKDLTQKHRELQQAIDGCAAAEAAVQQEAVQAATLAMQLNMALLRAEQADAQSSANRQQVEVLTDKLEHSLLKASEAEILLAEQKRDAEGAVNALKSQLEDSLQKAADAHLETGSNKQQLLLKENQLQVALRSVADAESLLSSQQQDAVIEAQHHQAQLKDALQQAAEAQRSASIHQEDAIDTKQLVVAQTEDLERSAMQVGTQS